MADYSNIIVNASMVDDFVFNAKQQYSEERIRQKQDIKRLKFAAEKRVLRTQQKEANKKILAEAQVEEQALRLRYQRCLADLKEAQEKELQAAKPEEVEEIKARQNRELLIFTGRDDKVLKEDQKRETAKLEAENKAELEALEKEYDEKIAAATDPDLISGLKQEKKYAITDLKSNQGHKNAVLTVNQKKEMGLTHYNVSKQRAKKSSMRRNRIIANTAVYIGLTLISIVWLTPFVLILLTSLRTEVDAAGDIYRGMAGYVFKIVDGVPQLGFANYAFLFTDTQFLLWYGNTLLIAVATCLGQAVMVILTAYGLSRLRFKGRKLIMNVMLILGMFPGFLSMLILYWVLKDWGMTEDGAVGGLILVNIASSGMGYYVTKGYFDTISKSLDEAARIDGATRLQVLYKVIVPMSGPIIVYVLLTGFMGPWADFIFASYLAMGHSSAYNVAVGMYQWLTNDMINNYYTVFCAGGVIVAIPVTVIFMFLQKYYVEGVTGGAVKG
ncbi:MAG: ABC transporter permease subunit [Coprobacillus sp.]|nr:ABC transporter permease subunit [Coprobacillus sp.]